MSETFDRGRSNRTPGQMLFGKIDDMLDRVALGIEKARDYLFAQQHEDGYWCGELEADTTLESDYIAIHTLLGKKVITRLFNAQGDTVQHVIDFSKKHLPWSPVRLPAE